MPREEAPSQIIARVPKNKRESVVVALGAFMGTPLVHVRIHYSDENGGDRPTAKGICVNVDRLPELRRAVEAAEVEAVRQGLLAGREGASAPSSSRRRR